MSSDTEVVKQLQVEVSALRRELDDLAVLRAGAWYGRLVRLTERAERAEAEVERLRAEAALRGDGA